MKQILFCTLLIALATTAFAADYAYLGSVVYTDNTDVPLAGVALKSDGDLYFVTFDADNSKLLYVADAITKSQDSSYTVTEIATTDVAIESGRGYNDVCLDPAGNVYVCGTGNSAATTAFKKYSAAPTHSELWSATLGARINGIEALDNNTIAVAREWNWLRFMDASDGSLFDPNIETQGGSNYGRAVALNSDNNDIYIAANGASHDWIIKVYSGGSPTNLSGYAYSVEGLLPGLGVSTQYGTAVQHIAYDSNNNQLLACDVNDQALTNDTDIGVRVYDISGSAATTAFTQVQYIQPITTDRDTVTNVNGVSYVHGDNEVDYMAMISVYTDGGDPATLSYYIDIYRSTTSVADWYLYAQ